MSQGGHFGIAEMALDLGGYKGKHPKGNPRLFG